MVKDWFAVEGQKSLSVFQFETETITEPPWVKRRWVSEICSNEITDILTDRRRMFYSLLVVVVIFFKKGKSF